MDDRWTLKGIDDDKCIALTCNTLTENGLDIISFADLLRAVATHRCIGSLAFETEMRWLTCCRFSIFNIHSWCPDRVDFAQYSSLSNPRLEKEQAADQTEEWDAYNQRRAQSTKILKTFHAIFPLFRLD